MRLGEGLTRTSRTGPVVGKGQTKRGDQSSERACSPLHHINRCPRTRERGPAERSSFKGGAEGAELRERRRGVTAEGGGVPCRPLHRLSRVRADTALGVPSATSPTSPMTPLWHLEQLAQTNVPHPRGPTAVLACRRRRPKGAAWALLAGRVTVGDATAAATERHPRSRTQPGRLV